MIKEILKGNKIVSKEENKIKKNKNIPKEKNRRINSVLNNFILFKKINLTKKPKQNMFENTKSLKIIINKKNANSYKKLSDAKSNHTLGNSHFPKNRNINNNFKNNFRINNSYTLKRKKELSREITNVNSINFDEKLNSYQNSLNRSNDKSNDINEQQHLNHKFESKKKKEAENENGCQKKKNIFLRNIKQENEIFISNLEQEFEIRCLKKKLKKLKNNNISLTQKLNVIMKKNYILKNETFNEQNKRKNIICSTINLCNKCSDKNENEEESNFQNLLLNLMEKKYNYDNLNLNNYFFNSIKDLFLFSNIFNGNKKRNINNSDGIYYNIKNLIRLKNKYMNEIKEYNIINNENKKYYIYIVNLCKKLKINNLDTLYQYLTNIKSSNDDEIKKIIKMKHVLFYDNKSNKKRTNVRSSEDNLNRRKFAINFNYADLQKYFIENNNKINLRNYSTKASNITIKTEKINFFTGCLTDRANHDTLDNVFFCNRTTKNNNEKINYYKKTREKLYDYKLNRIGKNYQYIQGFKNYIINTEKENDKDNNLLYYSYKQKLRNIPHNYRTFKRIEVKKNNNNNENSTSCNNLTSFNENKLNKKKVNRIDKYQINILNNNKLSNSTNFKYIGLRKSPEQNENEDENIKNENIKNDNNQIKMKNKIEKNNTYNNIIEDKKKSLHLKIPSLKSVNNYRAIIFNKK